MVQKIWETGNIFLVRGKNSNWEGRLSAIFYFCWQTIVHSHDIGIFLAYRMIFFFREKGLCFLWHSLSYIWHYLSTNVIHKSGLER